MAARPTGTVTFLFTDIEGSTRRWEHDTGEMQSAHARQEAVLRKAIEDNGGYTYKMIGDAFQAAFRTAPQALQAALDAQHTLHTERWGEAGELRVRMALHTGVTEEREGDYVGPLLNRVARLMAAGHGGQVLLTLAAAELVKDRLPPGTALRDLGEHHLRDLTRPEHIFQLVAPDLPADFPPLNTLDERPNNLPLQRSPLIGREREVAEVVAMLMRPDVALLTMTGPGGVGKTRLALQAATDLLDRFEDGVYFVTLAPLADAKLVPSSIAATLGVKEAAGRLVPDTLKDYLRDKHLLLVLDNFEQVAEAATTITDLLSEAPGLKVLATSREVLRVYAEHNYPVPPLALPDIKRLPPLARLAEYESVHMFVERAQAARPDFALSGSNAAAVAEVCYRLDGLPLAIELAAARVKVLSPQAILERLGNRLKLLTGGARDLPERQQTLRATIDWSYDLLHTGEQALFRRLAVFAGGATLEAADTVCSAEGDASFAGSGPGSVQALDIDSLDGVSSLVDKSLLQQDERPGGELCFVMLATVREYGLERLAEMGEEEAVRSRHAEFFLDYAERAAPGLQGPEQGAWLGRLETEHDNMRTALAWLLEREEAETALRLCVSLWDFWNYRGYFTEGRQSLGSALAQSEAMRTDTRARALYRAGLLAYNQDDYREARISYDEALEIFRELGDQQGTGELLNGLGLVAADEHDYAAARSFHEESLAIFRGLGDKRGAALALFHLANVAEATGDYASKQRFHEESLDLFRQLGNRIGIALSLNGLGEVARHNADYEAARSRYEESLAIFREVGHRRGIAQTVHNLGYVAHHQGHYSHAVSLFLEGLTLNQEVDNKRGVAECLAGLAGVVGARGEPERAVQLIGAASAMLEEMSATLEPADRAEYEHNLTTLRGRLEEAAFARAWSQGRAMSQEQTIALALELAGEAGTPPE